MCTVFPITVLMLICLHCCAALANSCSGKFCSDCVFWLLRSKETARPIKNSNTAADFMILLCSFTLPQRFWEIHFIKWSPILGKEAVSVWNFVCIVFCSHKVPFWIFQALKYKYIFFFEKVCYNGEIVVLGKNDG